MVAPNTITTFHVTARGAYQKSSNNNKAKYIKRRAKFQTFLEIVSCKCKHVKNKFNHFCIHGHI